MTPAPMTLRISRATRWGASAIRRARRWCGPRSASSSVALLVLEPGAAPARVVAADLLARRRVARASLLGAPEGAARARPARKHPRGPSDSLAGPAVARPAGHGRAGRRREPGHARGAGRAAARLEGLAGTGHREDADGRRRLLGDGHPEDRVGDLVADEAGELLVQAERLLAELVERIL